MRRFYFLVLWVLAFTFISYAQFERSFVIPAPPIGGFGNIVAGVDLDGDGKMEIYTCSNNVVDRPEELIPKVFKYEFNGISWDSVWGAVLSDVPLQNTWPALAVGDLDKDGLQELIYAPSNFTDAGTNPNPTRIAVYEQNSDKSDNLGVSDGFGGFSPNVKTPLLTADMKNMRPFRFIVANVDNDPDNELLFADAGGFWRFGIVSVSDVPNDGSGTPVWNIEANGETDPYWSTAGATRDIAIMNGMIYVFPSNGYAYRIKHNGTAYEYLPRLDSTLTSNGASWKSSKVVDINKDGVEEMLIAQYLPSSTGDTSTVVLITQNGENLTANKIATAKQYSVRNLSGDAGDVDDDGKIDYIFGTYNSATATPNNAVKRLEYSGTGLFTDANEWTLSLLDSMFFESGGDLDVIEVANLDADAADEVLYTSAYTRLDNEDSAMAIVIIDYTGPSSVQREDPKVPNNFFVSQNYPNPFNPATKISFGLPSEMNVDVRVYDVLGREVQVILAKQLLSAGTYSFFFDGKDLSSGTYIYKVTAGNNIVTKKMSLVK